MAAPKTQRHFEQRFLDHRERRLREESAKIRKSRFDSLKKRYATMVLGATLAVGGIGLPLKMSKAPQPAQKPRVQSSGMMHQLSEDLQAAQSVAREVTGGVEKAAETLRAPLAPLVEVEKDLSLLTEKATEEFFKKEIPFGSLIYSEAKKNNLKPELVAAVVKAESRFKPNARSHAGAQGLMQLVPRTGRWMGARDLMNPTQNVKAGTKYLKYLNERFDGNETKMIAAYNAGEGNVRRFGGVPPFKETRNYVRKVMNAASEYEEMINTAVAASTAMTSGGEQIAMR